jgi:Tol biopolymer transport system component/predicted Ser/Thr protein kinase
MTVTALSTRSRLGPYQIVSLLGAGGMGEVYRARDERLRRDVAIKVLPTGYARDPELLKRLEREARAISQLNHPNIVAVYDVGSQDGVEYLVMELLEGETLGTLLNAGPVSPRRALEYATQVARGLAAAHEKGIVHRDLKPDNVFITRDGRVKILDFGLAHQLRSEHDLSHLSSKLTTPGTTLGTVAYMSPEQARGLELDPRSDIFSFGAMLYEMLSGTLPFEEQTAFETMTAILNRETPDLRELVPNLPPVLCRVVTHCLEKSPDARFQTAHDLVFDLETCAALTWTPSTVSAIPAPPRQRRVAMIAGAVAALLILGAAAWTYWQRRTPPAAEASFRRLTFRPGLIPSARFTPDGETVVYSASWKGQPLRVHMLRTDRPESQALAIPNAELAAVSPTGEMAVILNARFYDWTGGGTLAVLPVLGGTPREIVNGVLLADWLPDGRMAVWRVNEKGEQQLEFPVGRVVYSSPNPVFALRVSPKGDQVALNVRTDGQKSEVVVIGLDGSKRTLASAVVFARGMAWTPDGREVWFTTPPDAQQVPTIYAVTMDGRQRLVMRTPGWPWLHDIARDGTVLMALNNNQGGIIVQTDGPEKERDLSWLDASVLADVSSDGKSILFTESNEGVEYKATVYMRATDDSPAVRLGEGIALAFSPTKDVALALRPGPQRRELILLPTGAGKTEVLRNDLEVLWAGWLPDGRILINAKTAEGQRMFTQGRDGKPPVPLTPAGLAIGSTNAVGGGAAKAVSPDGRSLLVFDRRKRAWLFPIGSARNAQPRPAPGVLPDERPGGWSHDSRHLYVSRSLEIPAKVYDVDLVTGERRLLREFALPDLDGVFRMGPFLLMPDGHSFAYGYYRQVSTLYTAKGLR